jgi:hypothetical protein
MAFKMRGFSGFKQTKDEEEIKDDIRFLPGDSDSDFSKPYNIDVIKQHILNKPRRNKKGKTKFEQNRDRVV